MRRIVFLVFLFLLLTSSVFASTSQSPPLTPSGTNSIDPTKEKEIRERIGVLQIPFIKNESQIKDSRVKYYANTFAGTVFITDEEIVYALKGENVGADTQVRPGRAEAQQAVPKKDYRRSGLWSFVGANPRVRPDGCIIKEKFLNAKKTEAIGIKEAETKVNYFRGNDPNNWKSNIQTYQEIGLGEVYDHIKLNLKAYGKNIEKLFIVEKGGKPEDIAVKVEGAKGLKVNEEGELEVETDLGTMKMTKPVAYQEIEGKRVDVAVNYALQPPPNPQSQAPIPECTYAFNVGDYNKDYPLVIDPLLASTFIGGSEYDHATSLVEDESGNLFVAGDTYSPDFPTTSGAYDQSYNEGGGPGNIGPGDLFISKFDSELNTLLASTFIGGSCVEDGRMALDPLGNIFVAGFTCSLDYPTTPEAYDRTYEGSYDGFVSKLDNDLTTLMASTLFGNGIATFLYDFAIDPSGDVFVTGKAYSEEFPVTPGAYDDSFNGGIDVFVSRLNNDLTTLVSSTFMGGSANEVGYAITLDRLGNVYVAGGTDSGDYPTTPGAYDQVHNPGGEWQTSDAFVSKFDNGLTNLMASTFLGGSGNDSVWLGTIAIDDSENVFVAGYTVSRNFPTTPRAYDRTFGGACYYGMPSPICINDGFVSKFNNDLTTLKASTFMGGMGSDNIAAIATDVSGNVFIAGSTGSFNYPTTPGAYDWIYSKGEAFISELDSGLESLLVSTFLGGGDYDAIYSLAFDAAGNVLVAGGTSSIHFPTTPDAYDRTYNGEYENPYPDAFISKFTADISEN